MQFVQQLPFYNRIANVNPAAASNFPLLQMNGAEVLAWAIALAKDDAYRRAGSARAWEKSADIWEGWQHHATTAAQVLGWKERIVSRLQRNGPAATLLQAQIQQELSDYGI